MALSKSWHVDPKRHSVVITAIPSPKWSQGCSGPCLKHLIREPHLAPFLDLLHFLMAASAVRNSPLACAPSKLQATEPIDWYPFDAHLGDPRHARV
jgi:hypothetical protein